MRGALDVMPTLVWIFHFLCNALGFDPAGQMGAQHIPMAETLVGAEYYVPFPPKVSSVWKFLVSFSSPDSSTLHSHLRV